MQYYFQVLRELDSTVKLNSEGVAAVRIRRDKKILVLACWDGKIRVYSVKSSKLLAVLDYHSESVQCLEFSHQKIDGKWLFAVEGKDGKVSLWTIYND